MGQTSNSGTDFLDDPPSVNVDVARLRLQLRDRTLAELEADGLIIWDQNTNTVRKGPRFEDDHPPLRDD